MLLKLIPYLLFGLFIWYLPELFLGSKNLSNYLFREATAVPTQKVEIKVVKKVKYLPVKYSVLSGGVPNLRVELASQTDDKIYTSKTDEEGIVVFPTLSNGTYNINVGNEVEFTEAEIAQINSRGMSAFEPGATFKTSISTVNITRDVYLSPIILE